MSLSDNITAVIINTTTCKAHINKHKDKLCQKKPKKINSFTASNEKNTTWGKMRKTKPGEWTRDQQNRCADGEVSETGWNKRPTFSATPSFSLQAPLRVHLLPQHHVLCLLKCLLTSGSNYWLFADPHRAKASSKHWFNMNLAPASTSH